MSPDEIEASIVGKDGRPVADDHLIPAREVRILCETGFVKGYARGWYGGVLSGLGLAMVVAGVAYLAAR